MSHSIKDPGELQRIYEKRFDRMLAYRYDIWAVLVEDFFQRYVPKDGSVLDLGCGYGEFINHVVCGQRFAMDLNQKAKEHLHPDVNFLAQDCSSPWALSPNSLDLVFTSNFFEHLPDKLALRNTLLNAYTCLKPGGLIVAMGPNIRYCPGEYWDFWDHFLCLTDRSLAEAFDNNGFETVERIPRFLPYSMVGRPKFPTIFLRTFLRMRFAWPLFGKQFVVVGRRL
jgi:SAM-dependent methyltransferase